MSAEEIVPLVLVVDTDDQTRDRFCEELQSSGYRAACAATIRSALEHLPDLPAVVVFCLEVDGSRHAKQQFVESLPRSATLILTSRDSGTAKELGLANAPFLRKPFTVDTFLEKVVESSRRRARR